MSGTPETRNSITSWTSVSKDPGAELSVQVEPNGEVRCRGSFMRKFRGGPELCGRMLARGEMIRCERCGGEHSVVDMLIALFGTDVDGFERLSYVARGRLVVVRALQAAAVACRMLRHDERSLPPVMPKWVAQFAGRAYEKGFLPMLDANGLGWVFVQDRSGSNRFDELLARAGVARTVTRDGLDAVIAASKQAMEPFSAATVDIIRDVRQYAAVKLGLLCYSGRSRDVQLLPRDWMDDSMEWVRNGGGFRDNPAMVCCGEEMPAMQVGIAGYTVIIYPPTE